MEVRGKFVGRIYEEVRDDEKQISRQARILGDLKHYNPITITTKLAASATTTIIMFVRFFTPY